MPSLEWVDRGESFRIATYRNLELAVWHSPPTLPQAKRMAGAGESLRRRHPRGVALFQMIPGGGMPDFSEDVRTEITRVATAGIFNLGAAHVILTPGLPGVAIRAFVGTVILVARSKTTQRAFDGCEGAAAWLLPRLAADDPTWSLAELTGVYQEALAAR